MSPGGGMSGNAERTRQSLDKPQWTDQQVDWILKKGRLVPFNRVANKLQQPADDKKCQRPMPVEEEKGQGDHNQRYANRVRQSIERMRVLGLIVLL